MLGLFYLASVTVSHIGAVIKENVYNFKAKVNPETNCFRDYYGNLRDNDTHEQRIELIDHNGDFILTDKHQNVVRNISEERRVNECAGKKNAVNRDKFMETTICTRQKKIVDVYNPYKKKNECVQGIVYRDIDTGKEYFKIELLVPSDYVEKSKRKLFYVSIDKPFDIVRMSDEQKGYEKIAKDSNKYNWIDSSEDSARFIHDYNSWPFEMDATHNLAHTKKHILSYL